MNLVKALVPGAVLTFVVAGIMGKNHSKGAWLTIERIAIQGTEFHWSWPLFGAGTLLAWVIFTITPK